MTQNPFGEMFGDIFSLLGRQGPDAWYQAAQQLAASVARGEDGDPNPSPIERPRLEEFAPLVARHVATLLGTDLDPSLEVSNRTALSLAALAQWRPLLEPLVGASGSVPALPDGDEAALVAQMASTLGPLLTGFQTGSIAGHFSERAWSLAALPLPRADGRHLIVLNNLTAFADAWSLGHDEVFVFALAQELVASRVLTQSGTGDALRALLLDAAGEARAVQGDILGRLQSLADGGDLAALMNDPSSLLEGLEVPDDSPATRAINAATAVLAAYFNAVAQSVTETLLGPRPALAEAVLRHRLSDARGEDAAAALFGISQQGPHVDEAARFVATLAAAHGLEVFGALLRVDGLATDAELREPEAWLERVTSSPLA
ncbi:MAG TPA: zinc-dependent metalloprotease [Acidimicrobiales bacterium]|nr:zinc-dependent metalloprotease [Acidimicrobiales bacterium]